MNPTDTPQNITLSSCEYTPVYLIQNNGVTQGTSYVLAPASQDHQRPTITNNLKLFYENSGNLDNGILLNTTQFVTKPIASPKPTQEQGGNNLKLASFLVPKSDFVKKQCFAAINNRIEPTGSTNSLNGKKNISIVSQVVNIEKEKFVKAKTMSSSVPRTLLKPVVKPKIKPKEETATPLVKHTSFQLLKLGGTYHSLNQLSDDQMRLVNKALENIGDPETSRLKPTYDPVTNTRIVYKVVSPNDLKVVGKNKIVVKGQQKSKELKKLEKIEVRKVAKVEIPPAKAAEPLKEKELKNEVKVTRSGRQVKTKYTEKAEVEATPPPKVKKKNAFPCVQCSEEFISRYRLIIHYEKEHLSRTSGHSDLFACLLAMIKNKSVEEKCDIFVRQVEVLVAKLREILPCLLRVADGGVSCPINEDLGRVFGLNAGSYNLNVDALNCVKDENGFCSHNPPPQAQYTTDISATPFTADLSDQFIVELSKTSEFTVDVTKPSQFTVDVNKPSQFPVDVSKPSQLWLSKHAEETALKETDDESCARILPVDKWQVKKVWKHKLEKKEKTHSTKKIRLKSEVIEPLIDLGNEVQDLIPEPDDTATDFPDTNDTNIIKIDEASLIKLFEKKNGSHLEFHSAHFDIRSSPMKPSATLFSKFQLVPEKSPSKSEVQFLRPLMFENQADVADTSDNSLDLNGILKELSSNHNNSNSNDLICKDADPITSLTFEPPKEWHIANSGDEQSHDSFLKPNSLIEPAMLHLRDNDSNKNYNDNATYDGSVTNYDSSIVNSDNLGSNIVSDNHMSLSQTPPSVLNFLDSLANDLNIPEAEMRNNPIDFQLDLFSFNHN